MLFSLFYQELMLNVYVFWLKMQIIHSPLAGRFALPAVAFSYQITRLAFNCHNLRNKYSNTAQNAGFYVALHKYYAG